ncbi:MAG: asparagine synthase C-terminal domain-containing protein, partial [Bacteroidota bacterium]|nr:asparagine synthase C-terminal domain-containing protein [Bacteroidota bacterium]
FDESSYQRIVIDYLKTKHSGVQCSSEEIANVFPEVIWHSETPILRTSPAPMYLLSNSVRENNYKVVITGEGADEMFAGYNIFKETTIRSFWAKQPNSKIRPLLLQKLYPYIPQLSERPGALKFFFGYKLTETDSPFYSHLLRWHNTARINSFLSDEIKGQLEDYDPLTELNKKIPEEFSNWSLLSKAQWLETSIFMSGYLLSSQGDRMAMANSIEGRYPFLDHRIIEFAATLPADYKLHGLNEKFLLKKLMQGKLPDSIIKRSKQAYRAPIQSAFLSKNAPEYVKHLLSPAYTKKAGLFNPDSVSAFLSKLKKTANSSEVENMILTAILSTHLLYFQFIEKQNKDLSDKKLNNLKIIEDI